MIRLQTRPPLRAIGALSLLALAAAWTALAISAPPPPKPGGAPAAPKKSFASTKTCAPPTGDPIPVERVMNDLMEGKNVDLTSRTIEGSLDADAFWPQAAAEKRATYRVIRGRLKLESCRITGRMAFPRCIFLQDISLSCTDILGDFDMSDSEVRGGIAGEKLRVVGDMRLTNASFDRDILFRGGVFESRVDLSGAKLHSVSFVDAEVRRSLELSHLSAALVDMSSLRTSGPVKIEDVVALVGITAREASFGRGLTMSAVKVVGQLDLSNASSGGDVTLSDVNVETDLDLPRIYEGSFSMSEVVVGRNLVMADGEFRDVTIDRLTVKGASRLESGRYVGLLTIGDTDFGVGFRANETLFSGDCAFRRVKFPGPDPMRGAQFVRMPTLVETNLPRIPTIVSDDGSAGNDDDGTGD
jgi:hypothetical protein